MKITISAWPGAGSTTIALILAKSLNFRLLRGTETFRFLGKLMSYENTGIDRFLADSYLEKDYGPIYDKYIDYVLTNKSEQNIVIESDIAVFRLGKTPDVFSVFMTTDRAIRAKRVIGDGRENDSDVMLERDEANRKFYKELHGVDWFDENEIKAKHSFVFDNSKLEIVDEIKKIGTEMLNHPGVDQMLVQKMIDNAQAEEENYWNRGKEFYSKLLHENNLLFEAEFVLKEINRLFKDEVEALPKEIREIVQRYR